MNNSLDDSNISQESDFEKKRKKKHVLALKCSFFLLGITLMALDLISSLVDNNFNLFYSFVVIPCAMLIIFGVSRLYLRFFYALDQNEK